MRAAASCDGLLRSRRLACTAVGGIRSAAAGPGSPWPLP